MTRRRDLLTQLTAEKEKLERQLAARSAPYRQEMGARNASFADLAKRLPRGTALVDIVQVDVMEPIAKGGTDLKRTPHYDAFALRQTDKEPGYTLEWVRLGSTALIDQKLKAWHGILARIGDKKNPPTKAEIEAAPEQSLRRLVWEPLEAKLGTSTAVLVIPDGALTRMPWAVLPGKAMRGAQLALLKAMPPEWSDAAKASYIGAWTLCGDPGDLAPPAARRPELEK